VAREPRDVGRRLEALLDDRDHLRVRISLAEEQAVNDELLEMRRKLIQLDKEIMARWGETDA
jgi:hypothetical protein